MYDRVYTIGCFDFFHYGHKRLLERLKQKGDKLIVGVHDDSSIEKLKNLKPDEHDPIETRMNNVKQIADIVYVIPDTDPTFYLKCIVRDDDNMENSCFMRGDDMPNFPGKDFVENKISIEYLSYTQGISSTKIRENNKKK